jgi:DNA-3-methyladenine glycosylase
VSPGDLPPPLAGARLLPPDFYLQPTLTVARRLLGAVLARIAPEGVTAGRIVEVEAYRGPADRAAHTAGGRRTPRNEVMWGPPARLYVYFTYGMHHCANVVTRPAGVPEAVLLRGLEPLAGIELMRLRRDLAAGAPASALARGPGNLCRALGIDRALNGAALAGPELLLLAGDPVPSRLVGRSPRVGVDYAGPDAALPWRFFVRNSPAVSGPRPAVRARARAAAR